MKLHGWEPDAPLYGKIVAGRCDFQRFEEAANILDEMVYIGTRRGIQVVSEGFWVMVDGFCKKGDVCKAAGLVGKMVDEGFVPVESVWKTIVNGFWEDECERSS
ncbi:hypothetical protein AMTR_s00095p00162810 [Amborella trichopoda]|uniref:Pentacotripeptide-repeat region of PRORP domain-containing protein n=1 Tax=Amborella trichopoda TaxID=13333 RepID=W1NT94_AMBTC|nr:hypothetical protein AMTR_s00095p00162810 [Amborella trichopoda]